MKPVDHTYKILYSELAQRTLDAQFSSDFPVEGRFISMLSGNRRYWYFDTAKADGGKHRLYVGPVDDDDIHRRVEQFKDLKTNNRSRRKLVSTLVREAYLPQPEALVGDIIGALATAGFFRLRGVLVGTVAFQCYSAILGGRLPLTTMQTGDADFAQFHSISAAVPDTLPPILDVLRAIDPTFREIPDQTDHRCTTRYSTRSGYKVEVLTPNTGSDDYADKPASMPALGGASAQPPRFLDFLIHEPVRAVILHGAGIPVFVPAPERFAIHKLVVGTRRRDSNDGTAKSDKDRQQAVTLMEAMLALRQGQALADAYMEAWDRGPAWRLAMRESLSTLDTAIYDHLRDRLSSHVKNLDGDPAKYGL